MVACLVIATMFLDASLVDHTDDGCSVEIHCAACLSHLVGLATQVLVPSMAPVWSLDIAPPDPTFRLGDTGTPSTLALRGPPVA